MNHSNRKTVSLAFYLVNDFFLDNFLIVELKIGAGQYEAYAVEILQFCPKGTLKQLVCSL